MSTLFTEESRIADLLGRAERLIARGQTEAAAAASIGVPLGTLQEWRRQLARAVQQHAARTLSTVQHATEEP